MIILLHRLARILIEVIKIYLLFLVNHILYKNYSRFIKCLIPLFNNRVANEYFENILKSAKYY